MGKSLSFVCIYVFIADILVSIYLLYGNHSVQCRLFSSVFDLYPINARSNNLVVKLKIQNQFLVENTENTDGVYKSNPTRNRSYIYSNHFC